MPLQSKAQERFLWAKMPAVAQKFEDDTPTSKPLPDKKKRKRGSRRR